MITDISYTPDGTLEVLTLAKAKKQLRIESDFTDEDDLIQDYINSAVELAEKFIGGHILPKVMTIKADAFENPLVFEAFPLKEVTSVEYFPKDGSEAITMPTTEYVLTQDSEKVVRLRFKNDLPAIATQFDAVSYVSRVGYETVPLGIVQAVKLMVSDMYERREDRSETIATVAQSILRAYKKY
jgi:uncharacterized phiE125 gp8 family phage protein